MHEIGKDNIQPWRNSDILWKTPLNDIRSLKFAIWGRSKVEAVHNASEWENRSEWNEASAQLQKLSSKVQLGIPVCSLRHIILTFIHLSRAGNISTNYSFCTHSPVRRPSGQGVHFLTGKYYDLFLWSCLILNPCLKNS